MHNKFVQRRPAKHKYTSRDKNSRQSSIAIFAKITWKQRRDIPLSQKSATSRKKSMKVISPSLINHLFRYATACFCPCFCVQQ